jgi:hypothetical protein
MSENTTLRAANEAREAQGLRPFTSMMMGTERGRRLVERFAAQSPNRARCESGWTGDRCTLPLFHDGPHSN